MVGSMKEIRDAENAGSHHGFCPSLDRLLRESILVDTHPELNRHFRLGIDTPGEFPY